MHANSTSKLCKFYISVCLLYMKVIHVKQKMGGGKTKEHQPRLLSGVLPFLDRGRYAEEQQRQ